MKTPWSEKTLLCYDYGLFVEWAVVLAREFKRVFYYTPWKDAYPNKRLATIGRGLPNLTRVTDLWDVEDQVDVWAFPDVGDGDLQEHLRRLGYLVWGSGKGEDFELDRWATKRWLKKVGLPVVPTEKVIGMDALEQLLKERENLWIKVSIFRGSVETWHHQTWATSERKMASIREDLGELGYDMEFIVEDDLGDDTHVEIGYDGWNIFGQWPTTSALGYEIKGEALAAIVKPYADFPKPVLAVNEKLAPVLKQYGYCGAISTELRVSEKGEPFLIDPCARFGSPPGELECELWTNWPEIVWEGVHGNVVDPKPAAKFGFELMLYSNWVSKHWAPIITDPENRKWVKLAFSAHLRHDNVIPQMFQSTKIGAVIGLGDTLDDAIDECVKHAEGITGLEVEYDLNAIDKARETIEQGESHQIDFMA